MSGLEPVAALGLICNILQLVELGRKTIDCIKTVYKEGKLDHDLEQNAVILEKLTNEMKKESRTGNEKYEAILFQAAASCSTAARDLQEELRFLIGNAKRGSVASAVKFTATVKWRQRRLERLARNLDMEEKRLQTGLLAQVWSSINAAHADTRGVRRELRFFIEQYRQGRRETTDLVSTEGLKTRELVSQEVERTNEAVALVDQKLDRLVLRQGAQMDGQIREEFLKSLKYPNFNQRRNQIHDAHEDTLKWIFVGDNNNDYGGEHDSWSVSDAGSGLGSEPEWSAEPDTEASQWEEEYDDPKLLSNIKWDSFSNWLRSTDTTYWISGKPGSGKTTLIKYILAHPRTRLYLNIWSPGCKILYHYFWRPGSPMQRNLEGLFCSLLYQLLDNNNTAIREVMSCISGPKDSFTDWSSTELRLALLRALDSCGNGVCLFLDGLDEINPENGTEDGIPELLEFASQLSQTGKIKLCLASRPTPHILEERLSMHPKLRLQDLNYADLMAYAKGHVKFPQTEMPDEYYDLIDVLVYIAEGVFLWLILAIKSINEGISHHDSSETLSERISRLPKGLDSLYQDMWARAGADSPSEYRQTAALYFRLLILSGWGGDSSLDMSSALRGLGIFRRGANVFDLMLATTSTADEILDAMDEPSKLICQDVMKQRCQEVERKLKIYCMGLVEEEIQDPTYRQASDWSWYAHTYDSVWPAANGPPLDFIHRTASDFLIDTETGRKILDLDTSSGFTLHYQLMKAWLAKLMLFASEDSADDWADQLRNIRETWDGTKEWVSKDWDRLVLICEKLANSGRLFTGGLYSAIPCAGTYFLNALARRDSDDELIISRLRSTDLSESDKSVILLNLGKSSIRLSQSGDELQSRLRTFRELLRAGADPNCQIWETTVVRPFVTLQTPWLTYLLNLMVDLTESDFVDGPTELAAMADITLLFISEGANLDDTVEMFLHWEWCDVENMDWALGGVGDSQCGGNDGVFASIPAYLIIKILAETLHLYSGSDKEPYLDSCVGLERACVNHSSSKPCRVFGKRTFKIGEFVVCETTYEKQTELGNRLIKSLKRQLSLTKPVIEGNNGPETDEPGQIETRKTILNDESWIEMTHGEDAFWEWLEELDLLQVVDESPGIVEWVRNHSQGFLQTGQTL